MLPYMLKFSKTAEEELPRILDLIRPQDVDFLAAYTTEELEEGPEQLLDSVP